MTDLKAMYLYRARDLDKVLPRTMAGKDPETGEMIELGSMSMVSPMEGTPGGEVITRQRSPYLMDDKHNVRFMPGMSLTPFKGRESPELIERFLNGTLWVGIFLDEQEMIYRFRTWICEEKYMVASDVDEYHAVIAAVLDFNARIG